MWVLEEGQALCRVGWRVCDQRFGLGECEMKVD